MEYNALILIHVASGIAWGGGIIVNGFFLVPSILESGPAGGQVMGAIMRRKYSSYMAGMAMLALLSGLRLYFMLFSTDWLFSPQGLVLTLGGLLALSAWAIGLFRQRPLAEKMAQLSKEGRHAELPEVAARFARYAKIAAWHLVAVILLMAGHRLATLL